MNVLGTIALVAGGLLVLWSLWISLATRRFCARCVTAQGTVVDFTSEEDSDSGGLWYFAVIRFHDAAGVAHQIGGGHGSQQPPTLGETCSVTYDPDMPSNAWITGTGCMWIFPAVIFLVGFAVIVLGIQLRRA